MGVNGKNLSVSAIVIATPSHLKYLASCLGDIRGQSLAVDELVLVASGFSSHDTKQLQGVLELFEDFPAKVLNTPLAPAGFNRNRGAEIAIGDLLVFFDADDRYHPHRVRAVRDAIQKTDCEIVLHSYNTFAGPFGDREMVWLSSPIEHQTVNAHTITKDDVWGKGISRRNRDAEMSGAPSTIIVPGNSYTIAHGHLSIRKNHFLRGPRQHEFFFPRNEDSVYLLDCLECGYSITFLDVALSAYQIGSSSKTFRNYVPFWGLSVAVWAKFRDLIRKLMK